MHIKRGKVRYYRAQNNPVITNYKLLSCMKDVIILYITMWRDEV